MYFYLVQMMYNIQVTISPFFINSENLDLELYRNNLAIHFLKGLKLCSILCHNLKCFYYIRYISYMTILSYITSLVNFRYTPNIIVT